MTLLQNMVDASKESDYWTPNALIQAIVGIWFAASHQPWIVSDIQLTELQPTLRLASSEPPLRPFGTMLTPRVCPIVKT